MTTPHIHAAAGAFAETVLMPGDPLRAKHIADTFLTDVQCINTVRNMYGFTGKYNGKPVSVMGSGMGVPSMSIYATELVKYYGVKNIIRIGSCGGLPLSVKVREVVVAMGASTDSAVNRNRLQGMDFAALASFELLERAVAAARAKNIGVKVGNVFTSDLFYNPDATRCLIHLKNMAFLACRDGSCWFIWRCRRIWHQCAGDYDSVGSYSYW